jgi:ribosomal protein S18 acetylase RimI-like enzyme
MNISIRFARREDISAIVPLEQAVFPGDRLSRRSFLRLCQGKSAVSLVAEAWAHKDKALAGYAVVLLRKTSGIARLYSIAVSPAYQGQGVAKRLIEATEKEAAKRAKTRMRLEVRADNKTAITLYLKLGYKPFGNRLRYYDDGMDALRFEKTLE